MSATAAFTAAPAVFAGSSARVFPTASRRSAVAPTTAVASTRRVSVSCMTSGTPKPVTDVEDDGGDGFFGSADVSEALGVSVDFSDGDKEYLDAAVDQADLIERIKVLARAYEEKRTAPRKGKGMPQAGDYLNNL
ncbi:hypothetical protein MMPV_008211 [Pyropia vietnamensis]